MNTQTPHQGASETYALARRALACKGWRWMPGMLAVEWAVPGMVLTDGRPVRVDDRWHEVGVWLPDLSDPATLGCVLALVREAWGDPTAHVEPSYEGKWRAWAGRYSADNPPISRSTEAEALVAALEAAGAVGVTHGR